ncbi:MAG TPA: TRAP transporter small permease [Castellaniella sp.]|uniref:TRAP transporter small permease n=1 Tax=Castellaniella sp. TaxID=1955812 RepID=UPI002F014B7B
MNTFDKIVTRIENAAMAIAAIILALMVLAETYNVVMRYFFSAPPGWVYPVVTNYVLEGLFFLAISWTLRTDGHIQLDLLSIHFSHGLKKLVGIVCNLVALAFFATILYLGALRTLEAIIHWDISPDVLRWPLWTSYIFVPIGCGIICLRLLYRIAAATPIVSHEAPPN